MIFFTIRLFFVTILFIILFLLIKRSKIVKKDLCNTLLVVLLTVVLGVSYLATPIENLFLTFSSVEKAFTYVSTQSVKDILCVVDGKETSLVVAANGEENALKIFPMTENGWKLNAGLETVTIMQQHCGNASIHIYRYKKSNDYYINIFNANGGPIEINDNRDSLFYSVERPNSILGQPLYYYYSCVQNIQDDYIIYIDGQEVKIEKSGDGFTVLTKVN